METPHENKYYSVTCNVIDKYDRKDNSINIYDYLYALALYASFDFEQDAMIHSLYGKLKEHDYTLLELRKTNEYLYRNDMENALAMIKIYPDSFNEKLFSISKEQYQHIIEKSLKRYRNKLGKLQQLLKKNIKLNEGLINFVHIAWDEPGHIKCDFFKPFKRG